MLNKRVPIPRPAHGWRTVALFIWLAVASLPALEMDVTLPTLRSGTEVFTNVTVYGRSETDLFIRHSRGFGNVKIKTLDDPTLRALRLGGATPSDELAAGNQSGDGFFTSGGSKWRGPSEPEALRAVSRFKPGAGLLAGVMVMLALAYLFFCICAKLVCLNAGSRPGVLIWFPVLQMFPLLRAAGMSAWWFVVFLIPLVSVVAHIVWCVKISKACGRGGLTAVLLILPVTNLVAFLYLAFSRSSNEPPVIVNQPQTRGAALAEA